jgi:hypothetical protein
MNPALILQILALAEQLFSTASTAYVQIKGDLDAKTQADIAAAVARSGAALDAARAQLDADAA